MFHVDERMIHETFFIVYETHVIVYYIIHL